MRVAQVTDPHVSRPGTILFGGYDPAAALSHVLARIARLRPAPDLVFFTGDLTENGLPEEYAHFLDIVAPFGLPMAAIPGNHDRREAFAAAFAGSGVLTGDDPSRGLRVAIEDPRVLGLDTLARAGEPSGMLDEPQLAWLSQRLAAAEGAPVLIFMHHPPILTGIASMDVWRLGDPGPLAEIVARFPNVLRICCGHVHRAVEARFAGTACGVCPSVAWAVPLFEPAVRAPLVPAAPAFQLHVLEGGAIVTHTEYLADFAPRLPRTRSSA